MSSFKRENSITHAPAVPSNLDAAITLHFAAWRGKPARIYARGNIRLRQSCSHSNAICNHSFKKRTELRTQEQPLVAEHRGGTKTTAAATAAHTRYLSSPAAATLHGKTQRFVLRLPPQNIAHATFMQPSQCDPQPQIQETHRTTHTGTTTRWRTQTRNQNDRSRNRRTHEVRFIAGRSPAFLPTTQSMQHSCSHSNAICNHRFKKRTELRTQEQPLVAEHRGGTKTTAAATAAHTRYLSSPAAATLHGKTQRFVLRLPPQNIAHATFMQPLQYVSQHHVSNLHVSTHMATPDDNKHAAITRAYCYVMSSLTPHSHTTLHWVYCYVMSSLTPHSHTTLHWVYWYVMSSLTPPCIVCIVMWCKISHHPSLSVLLCDVKSHTTLHCVYCYVM